MGSAAELEEHDLAETVATPQARGPGRTERLLLRPEEAAEALGIGRSTLYGLLACGQLASVRIGALRRIPTEALHEFVHTLERAAEPAPRAIMRASQPSAAPAQIAEATEEPAPSSEPPVLETEPPAPETPNALPTTSRCDRWRSPT